MRRRQGAAANAADPDQALGIASDIAQSDQPEQIINRGIGARLAAVLGIAKALQRFKIEVVEAQLTMRSRHGNSGTEFRTQTMRAASVAINPDQRLINR
jgi:hypothetical protein